MRKILATAGALIALPVMAHAQIVSTDGVDQLLTKFHTVSAGWAGPLENLALGTFGLLAVIDLVWFVGIKTMLSGNWELSGFMNALVHEVLFIAFFFWIATAWATTTPLIISGFEYAAHQAGGIPMTPNAIFNEGTNLATQIGNQASIWHPGDALVTIVCALVVQFCFVGIVCSMVYVIVESYFIVSAGQILCMFGALRFTSDIPVNLIRACIGIGLKLFALQLIASVGTAFIQQWTASITTASLTGLLIEIGETVLLLGISLSVPHMLERTVTHIGTGSVGNVLGAGATIAGGAALATKAATMAATRVAGWGAAGASAARLANTQAASDPNAPTSTSRRAASLVGSTARNMVMAKVDDVHRGLAGQRAQMGSPPWRQAANMAEQRRVLSEDAKKMEGGAP